jgi:hypothetical protein
MTDSSITKPSSPAATITATIRLFVVNQIATASGVAAFLHSVWYQDKTVNSQDRQLFSCCSSYQLAQQLLLP